MYNINTKVIIRSYIILGPSKVYDKDVRKCPTTGSDRSERRLKGKGISKEVSIFFLDLNPIPAGSQSLWTVKNDCGNPTHQTRQQWTAKDAEKNRVSFKIITQNNKNVIFIGFDGLFDLKRPQKSKKKH